MLEKDINYTLDDEKEDLKRRVDKSDYLNNKHKDELEMMK